MLRVAPAPPGQEGRICASRKFCKASLAAQTGWWVKLQERILGWCWPHHPASLVVASQNFLMPLGPPLLARHSCPNYPEPILGFGNGNAWGEGSPSWPGGAAHDPRNFAKHP